jgi:hypothetical protein
MLVRDTPLAIDVAQADCQPEEEPAFLRRTADAPHDGDREGDIFTGGNGELFDVEGL